MKITIWRMLLLSVVLSMLSGCNQLALNPDTRATTTEMPESTIKLPEPKLKGDMSLEEALFQRRSIREYARQPLTLEEVSQLLWAAQGVTTTSGGRTVPSAGALYPIEVYISVANVTSLSPGVYKYLPEKHELVPTVNTDVRQQLAEAAVSQAWVAEAAANIVIGAVYERTTVKYGERGLRYVHMEAGHAAQNIYLEATVLGLGTVSIGAFDDNQVKNILGMASNENPLYILPVGKKLAS